MRVSHHVLGGVVASEAVARLALDALKRRVLRLGGQRVAGPARRIGPLHVGEALEAPRVGRVEPASIRVDVAGPAARRADRLGRPSHPRACGESRYREDREAPARYSAEARHAAEVPPRRARVKPRPRDGRESSRALPFKLSQRRGRAATLGPVKVLGLTGGIGSGKSTVAGMLADLGARVIDADVLAREAVAPGTPGLEAIRARFGEGVLDPGGALDRRALGRLVFEDPAARADLERIVHPRVAGLAADQIRRAEDEGAPLAVYDVPLLYENGLERSLPEVCVVWASRPTRLARIAARDPLTPGEIEARMAAQMPLEEKVRRADHVIDNDGDLASTRAAVASLYAALVKEPPGVRPK